MKAVPSPLSSTSSSPRVAGKRSGASSPAVAPSTSGGAVSASRAVASSRAASSGARSTPASTRQRIRPETRAQLLERLTNPQITLHEASVILRVCPATVRNYCNAGYLPHDRTPGGQRRFRLNEVLAFAREREAEQRK